jgi:hypothetical protein
MRTAMMFRWASIVGVLAIAIVVVALALIARLRQEVFEREIAAMCRNLPGMQVTQYIQTAEAKGFVRVASPERQQLFATVGSDPTRPSQEVVAYTVVHRAEDQAWQQIQAPDHRTTVLLIGTVRAMDDVVLRVDAEGRRRDDTTAWSQVLFLEVSACHQVSGPS